MESPQKREVDVTAILHQLNLLPQNTSVQVLRQHCERFAARCGALLEWSADATCPLPGFFQAQGAWRAGISTLGGKQVIVMEHTDPAVNASLAVDHVRAESEKDMREKKFSLQNSLEQLQKITDIREHGSMLRTYLGILAQPVYAHVGIDTVPFAQAAIRDRATRFPLADMDETSLAFLGENQVIKGRGWKVTPFAGGYYEIGAENQTRLPLSPEEALAEEQFRDLSVWVAQNLQAFTSREWRSVLAEYRQRACPQLNALALVPEGRDRECSVPQHWEDQLRAIARGNTGELYAYIARQLPPEKIRDFRMLQKAKRPLEEILEALNMCREHVMPFTELPGGQVLVHMRGQRFGLPQWWVEHIGKEQYAALRAAGDPVHPPEPVPQKKGFWTRWQSLWGKRDGNAS